MKSSIFRSCGTSGPSAAALTKFDRLKTVCVYVSDQICFKPYVLYLKPETPERIYGKPLSSSRLMVDLDEADVAKEVSIYVEAALHVKSGFPTADLAEEIVKIFSFPAGVKQNLVLSVLTEPDPAENRDKLTKAGIELNEEDFPSAEVVSQIDLARRTTLKPASMINGSTKSAGGITTGRQTRTRLFDVALHGSATNAGVRSGSSPMSESIMRFNGHQQPARRLSSSTLDSITKAASTRRTCIPHEARQQAASTSHSSFYRPGTTLAENLSIPAADPQIGLEGEFYVFELLKSVAGSEFQIENWTSELRHLARPGVTAWEPDDPDTVYTDFTFNDASHNLTKWLVEQQVEGAKQWLLKRPTYHIEVKSTADTANQPFHMSNSQMAHACQMADTDQDCQDVDIYLCFRVSELTNTAGLSLTILTNVWKQFTENKLHVQAQGGWVLTL